MIAKDIKVGVEYAASEWGQLDHVDLFLNYGRPESKPPDGSDWARDWREALRTTSLYAHRVRVIEKGVPVGSYARPGVLVQKLDRETGEPLDEAQFRAARDDLERMRELEFILFDIDDAMVAKVVLDRNPEGNPYLREED